MTKLKQWFHESGYAEINAFQLQSIKNNEAYEQEYHQKIKFFFTDVKGSVVLPEGFHAWLFIGTEKNYDDKITELESMSKEGKVIGTFSYNSYDEWNNVHGSPVGTNESWD